MGVCGGRWGSAGVSGGLRGAPLGNSYDSEVTRQDI